MNILKDISIITNVPYKTLERLSDLAEKCVAHDVLESYLGKNTSCSLDIGIGTIYLLIEEDGIEYKFIPSPSLEKKIVLSIESNTSPLITDAEKLLNEKIKQVYKELM